MGKIKYQSLPAKKTTFSGGINPDAFTEASSKPATYPTLGSMYIMGNFISSPRITEQDMDSGGMIYYVSDGAYSIRTAPEPAKEKPEDPFCTDLKRWMGL